MTGFVQPPGSAPKAKGGQPGQRAATAPQSSAEAHRVLQTRAETLPRHVSDFNTATGEWANAALVIHGKSQIGLSKGHRNDMTITAVSTEARKVLNDRFPPPLKEF